MDIQIQLKKEKFLNRNGEEEQEANIVCYIKDAYTIGWEELIRKTTKQSIKEWIDFIESNIFSLIKEKKPEVFTSVIRKNCIVFIDKVIFFQKEK
jgi:acetamidase/formamidase